MITTADRLELIASIMSNLESYCFATPFYQKMKLGKEKKNCKDILTASEPSDTNMT
jgi:hypothetical protein